MPRNHRDKRCASSPYWTSGPGAGVLVDGMKPREALDLWIPALPPMGSCTRGDRVVLKMLEICSGGCSVSRAAAQEAREQGHEVEVFSIDGKPGAGATKVVDILTWDWANDAELLAFRADTPEEGVTCIYYAHASPPCGPYSSMANRYIGSLAERDLRWGDSVVQRCLELIQWFAPDFWTIESKGPPGLDSRTFMQSLEPMRSTVTYCSYGWNRYKPTSIWTNVTWKPEPRCVCRLGNCCEHYREHGRHLDKVQEAKRSNPDFAALPEQLVRAWTRAALVELLGEV